MEKIKQPKSLFSRNEEVYFSRGQRKCYRLASEGKSCRPQVNRRNVRVTTSQYETSGKNNAHLLSHNLPAGEKIHWDKH